MAELETKRGKGKFSSAYLKYKIYKLLSKVTSGKKCEKFKAKDEKYKALI